MANRMKGEIPVEVGGRTLIFRLGINELIGLQDALGMRDDDEKFLASLDNLRGLKRLRAAVKAALLFRQPETTDETAGDVISELGFARVGELIAEALLWAMPEKAAPGPSRGKGAAASPGGLPS